VTTTELPQFRAVPDWDKTNQCTAWYVHVLTNNMINGRRVWSGIGTAFSEEGIDLLIRRYVRFRENKPRFYQPHQNSVNGVIDVERVYNAVT